LNKLIIANWKMHGRHEQIEAYCQALPKLNIANSTTESIAKGVVLAPPMHLLVPMKHALPNGYSLGAQVVSAHGNDGAHTGEVNSAMLQDIGCTYVLIGHSERRQTGENTICISAQLDNSLAAGLIPVLCVGEPLEQRTAGNAQAWVGEQLKVLEALAITARILIAYEPIWAIGTGQVASEAEIEQMHGFIHSRTERAVLYGGSVNVGNVKQLLALDNVSGALVGGASLDVQKFSAIIRAGQA